MRTIELLSPAKNLQCGIAAVNHGADAVYIGGPMFGARAAAGNSLQDIGRLADYAHRFRSKIYVTLNTILADDELEMARNLVFQLYEEGVDALIVQDYALLKMDLPPIPLHASTQIDARTVAKARFLADVGFSQIVLARELSLKQIREIARDVKVPLEVFVHGALCVSYSGQCYLSQSIMGRSANRGECGQPCRLPYDLYDADGHLLVEKKHLLSLKDMDRSAFVADLVEAGVSSFKIEGRLKDLEYVKNVTAFYRETIDRVLEGRGDVRQASSGTVRFAFKPDIHKTFNRGGTDYLLKGGRESISSPHTPKSIGEEIGVVKSVGHGFIDVTECSMPLHNGDGFCFLSADGTFYGFRVNRIEGCRLFFSAEKLVWDALHAGTRIRRNVDMEFLKLLSSDDSAVRIIRLDVFLDSIKDGFRLTLSDEDGVSSCHDFACEHTEAQQTERALETIRRTLSKTGSTAYRVCHVHVESSPVPFIPASVLSEARRQAVANHDRMRLMTYVRKTKTDSKDGRQEYPERRLSYLGNVHNRLAAEFLREHGVTDIAPSFERQPQSDVALMFCRHCVRYLVGLCAKHPNPNPLPMRYSSVHEPLYLQSQNNRLRLEFDCAECEMRIFRKENI